MANTLLAPEGVKIYLAVSFQCRLIKTNITLNTQVFEDVHLFDEALEVCEELAEQTQGKKPETEADFTNILKQHYKAGGIKPTGGGKLLQNLYRA